jgi:hypothetical protein
VLYNIIFMSVNRSVAAAQRRRAGPPETNQMRSGPNTSINSAQLFANQAKPGNGPSIPVGKLAAQQVNSASSRQQQQQQQQYESQGATTDAFSKMTVPQAITLITLRLGKVETMLQNQEHKPSFGQTSEFDESSSQVDTNFLESIVSRLESLEKRSSVVSSSGASGPEMTLLKQQVETFKPLFTQTKTATASVIKENKELKSQVEALRAELEETKELVLALQNITMDNSQKLLALSLNEEQLLDGFEQTLDEGLNEEDDEQLDASLVDSTDISIIDLKELVKQEFTLEA